MNSEQRRSMFDLIRTHRQATLAVADGDEPLTAMVSYVEEADYAAVLIHLSTLSAHKRVLQSNLMCSNYSGQPFFQRETHYSLPLRGRE